MNNATLRQALEQIFREYGTSVLNDGERLVALFSDFAPMLKKEKILLKNVAGAGLLAPLMAAQNESATEQKRVCEVLCERMHEDLFIDENAAGEFVSDIAAALGWAYAPEKKSVSLPQPMQSTHSSSPAPVQSVPQPNIAASPASDFEYENKNGGAVITRYRGGKSTVGIPAQLGGANVVAIGERAFWNCTEITAISLPSTLTQIEAWAFIGCNGIQTIVLPDSVREIGDNAFRDCKALSSVSLSANLEKIGEKAFFNCQSLGSITIGARVKTIGSGAFGNCPVTVSAPKSAASYSYTPDDGVKWSGISSSPTPAPKPAPVVQNNKKSTPAPVPTPAPVDQVSLMNSSTVNSQNTLPVPTKKKTGIFAQMQSKLKASKNTQYACAPRPVAWLYVALIACGMLGGGLLCLFGLDAVFADTLANIIDDYFPKLVFTIAFIVVGAGMGGLFAHFARNKYVNSPRPWLYYLLLIPATVAADVLATILLAIVIMLVLLIIQAIVYIIVVVIILGILGSSCSG